MLGVLIAFTMFCSGCQTTLVKRDKAYLNHYPKTSENADTILNLHSNQQRTTFYVDGEKMVTGRRVKILIDNRPHTVIASPEGYTVKEEYIQPPYMENSILSFTFLLGDRLSSYVSDSSAITTNTASIDRIKSKPTTGAAKPLKMKSQYAVIIGISEYQYADGKNLSNLAFADNDARDFSNELNRLGWSRSQIRLLINEQATLRNIRIAMDSWLTKTGPDDLIVLYWSGHGYPDPEDPTKVYFACYDTDISIPATGYRMDHVRSSLEEKKARNVLVLADTCHAGKLITRGNKGISIIPQLKSMEKAKTIPKGWIFMVGADSDRQAIEHTSWSNGAFTRSLLNALSGQADGYLSAGLKDGLVNMAELRAYLNSSMPDETQKVLGAAKRPLITTSCGDPDIWNLTLQVK